MNEFAKNLLCVMLATLVVGALPGMAQDATDSRNRKILPPELPMVKPPIERFRELLSLSPVERQRALAEKTPEQRSVLAAKLKEYEAMTAEDRELRLAVTELRWYLVPMLNTPPSDRASWLNSIPAAKRTLVEDRLRRWDTLTKSQQKEFLESEMTINYLLRLQSSSPEQQANIMREVPSTKRQQLQVEWAHWRSLPEKHRARVYSRFQQFFDLNAEEKAKALGSLSDAERAQMEKALKTFQTLPGDQRQQCIRSFGKLANMSAGERHQFLRKAELWAEMSPSDREAWRGLVQKLPQMPPLPPGMQLIPPLPPIPRVATNRAGE